MNNCNAVKIWIIDNQEGRRNLPTFVKFDLQIKRRGFVDMIEQAKANQATSTGGSNPQLIVKSQKADPVSTTKAVAAKIGGSTGGYRRIWIYWRF